MKVFWKPVQLYNMDGETFWKTPEFLSSDPLLLQKLSLLEGKPIPFQEAIALYNEALLEGLDTAPGMMASLHKLGLAGWLQLQGYKPVLNGKEYEVES